LATPKSLVAALHSHWETVEWLVQLSREMPSFDAGQVLAVVARLAPALPPDARQQVLRQLVYADILQPLARGEAFQLNAYVLEFVRGLTREHELGLSAVLSSRVNAVTDASRKLNEGMHSGDADLQRQAATRLSELFRQISQQLDQDRHAIQELAERAKSRDTDMPVARRYREVLEAYDNYVAPMAEMMDSGPGGIFYRHLEEAEHALDHAVEALTVRGALYSHRTAMRDVAFQAKELRRLGREVLKHCSDTLLPLREEVRQHNLLSSAISHLLGRVRKRGLNRTLPAGAMPLWRREVSRGVSVGPEVLAIMHGARGYVPLQVDFPEEHGAAAMPAMDLVDEAALAARLKGDAPVNDLLAWLRASYPELGDATLLRLYHELIARPDWQTVQSDEATRVVLNQVRVTLYPHQITLR
jgi:hypothetical protein